MAEPNDLSRGTFHPGAEGADAVFCASRSIAIQYGACFVAFSAMGVASAIVGWFDSEPCRRTPTVAFFSLFWGAWASIAFWTLLACWRGSLTIQGGTVIAQGVVKRKDFKLADLNTAKWTLGKCGGIKIGDGSKKLWLSFEFFRRNERLWLIRYFRYALPESIQEGWNLFCYKIAVDLRDAVPNRKPIPGPDEIVVNHQRWDRTLITAVLSCATIAGIAYWMLGDPRLLTAPTVPTLMWGIFRLLIPTQGFVSQRIGAPGLKQFLLFGLCWVTIAIGGIFGLKSLDLPSPYHACLLIAWTPMTMAVLLWRASIEDRERQKRTLEAAKASVQQWEEGEPSPIAG